MITFRTTIGILVTLFLVASCNTSAPNQETIETQANVPSVVVKQPETLDDMFIRVSKNLPGFAGLHYDESNNLVVSMKTDPNSRAAINKNMVEEQISAVFGQELFMSTSSYQAKASSVATELIIRPVEFSMIELADIFKKLRTVMFLESVTFIDIDEKINKVYIGVENNKIVTTIRNQFDSLGVPPESVVIEKVGEVSDKAALTDKIEPPLGGLKITRKFGTYICTISFPAKFTDFGGRTYDGFITASHCTTRKFASDFVAIYQPVYVSGTNAIGEEHYDPNPPVDNLFGGAYIRYSDSAFIRSGTLPKVNGMAQVTSYADPGYRGSIIIRGRAPIDKLGSNNDISIIGTTLSKVGAGTGGTNGKLKRTCVDVKTTAYVGTWTLRCQFTANYTFGYGDSGSPVIRYGSRPGQPFFTVNVVGINWGSTSTEVFFSPISGIIRDFGRSDSIVLLK